MKLAALLIATLTTAASAQEPGWHYSPYASEGDRAAMGCARTSTPKAHACVVVRCEDDSSVALYIKSSRPQGDVTDWVLQIDDAAPLLKTVPVEADLPYGAQVIETETPIPRLVDLLRNGGAAFLEAIDGGAPVPEGIPMTGSMTAIDTALYYCVPKAP
jgi:hypothetical protein